MSVPSRIEVCYPRSPGLDALAERLERRLAHYRIPGDVRRKTGLTSVREVKEAWLIVLCTPETPGDPAVRAAIGRFRATGRQDRILTLLVSGSPEESFPASLRFAERPDGSVAEIEPLAANITAEGERQRRKKLGTELLRLLAPILGVSFDDLRNRRRRQRSRVLLTIAALALLGAAAFLGYALNRMGILRGQNADLSLRYAEAEAAREEARAQRDAAREALARKVGTQAAKVLAEGDSELALLLCLEYLPEMEQVTELTDALGNALETLCASGYVPVTARTAYIRTREPRETGEETGAAPSEEAEYVPEQLSSPKPADRAYKNPEELTLKRFAWSEKYGYALYTAELRPASEETNFNALFVHIPDTPERDYFLMKDGLCVRMTDAYILGDGSVFISCEDAALRLNALSGELLPVFDGEAEREASLPFPVALFWAGEAIPGRTRDLGRFWKIKGFEDRIFGLGAGGVQVYSREPFRLLYTVADERTADARMVPDGNTYWIGFGAVALPDGNRFLVVDMKHFYDAETGEFLYSIEDMGQSIGGQVVQFSAEGYMPLVFGDNLCLWDIEAGEPFWVFRNADERYLLYGPLDEASGRRSASRIVLGCDDNNWPSGYDLPVEGVVWEYRAEALPIPEDLEGRVALARELLKGRELSPSERTTYHLED